MNWHMTCNTFDIPIHPKTQNPLADFSRRQLILTDTKSGYTIELNYDPPFEKKDKAGYLIKIIHPNFKSPKDVDDFLERNLKDKRIHWDISETAQTFIRSADIKLDTLLERQSSAVLNLFVAPEISLPDGFIALIMQYAHFRKPTPLEKHYFAALVGLDKQSFTERLTEAQEIIETFKTKNEIDLARHSDALMVLGEVCYDMDLIDEAVIAFKLIISEPDSRYYTQAQLARIKAEQILFVRDNADKALTERDNLRLALDKIILILAQGDGDFRLIIELFTKLTAYSGLDDTSLSLTELDLGDPVASFQFMLQICDACYHARRENESLKQQIMQQSSQKDDSAMQNLVQNTARTLVFSSPSSSTTSEGLQQTAVSQNTSPRHRPQ